MASTALIGQKVYDDPVFNTMSVLQSYRQTADYFTQHTFGTYTAASNTPVHTDQQAGLIVLNGGVPITIAATGVGFVYTLTLVNPLITGKTIFELLPQFNNVVATNTTVAGTVNSYGFASVDNVVGAFNGPPGTVYATPGQANIRVVDQFSTGTVSVFSSLTSLHYKLINPLVLQ